MGKDSELITLIKSGTPDGVKKYLTKLRKSGSAKKMGTINSQNDEGLSALHLCAMRNLKEILEDLLDMKASVNMKDNRGLTPLHYTAFRGNLESAILLLEYQANPCVAANNGESPLHVAAQYGHASVMSLLIDYQANPLVSNNTAQTPLDIACFMGHTKAVKVLLDTGCFPNKQYGVQSLVQSPIHLCAKQGHTEILKMLVEVGFSVDEIGPNGTPLHEAALYGRVDVVKLLIQLRCDQNLKNSQNQTAMDLVHKFTNPRAYTSRQILQALSQARPVSIPRPPSFTQSSQNLAPSPTNSSNSFQPFPDNQLLAQSDSSSMDTPVRDRNVDFSPPGNELDTGLIISPVPTYNEYEAPGENSCFASMIAQAAVMRKDSNPPNPPRPKISNTYVPQNSDPMDRLACVKSSKRESFSNSSTDTSFSFTSNSGVSTGVSTPDSRYQSPSPANLPPQLHQNRTAFQSDLPSNDTYDVPDDCQFNHLNQFNQFNHPVTRVANSSLAHDLYDTPSPNPRLAEFNYYQGDSRNVSKAPKPIPSEIPKPIPDNSMVLKKLTLPAGFNNLDNPQQQQQPIYDNQIAPDEIISPENIPPQPASTFQAPHPVDMEALPPRPLSKPRILAKPGMVGALNPGEKQHLSELQKKLVMRKKVSETALAPPAPPAPPTTSPPPMTTQAELPPQKPPRVQPNTPANQFPTSEERDSSPEPDSQFLEALKLRKGSLKRTDKIAPPQAPIDPIMDPFLPPSNHPTPPKPSMISPTPPKPINTNISPPKPNNIDPKPMNLSLNSQKTSEIDKLPPKPSAINTVPSKPIDTNPKTVVSNSLPAQHVNHDQNLSQSLPMKANIPDAPSGHQAENIEHRRERSGTIISKISSTDSWELDRFLSALKLSEYLVPLSEAGYAESADLVGLTTDDVTAAGVVKAGHRKKLITSIQSLTARHKGYEHIPSSIDTWLAQWHLTSYHDTLVDSGYDDIEFIADMTREELRELGIQKVPVLNRFSHALSHLQACIQSHRSIVLSASPQVTPQKPSPAAKQPQQQNINQECPKPPTSKPPPADFTPPPPAPLKSPPKINTNNNVHKEVNMRSNTQDTPTPPPSNTVTSHGPLVKSTSNPPAVLRKPTLPPPVSRKPPPERRNSKQLHSPDLIPSPTQLDSPDQISSQNSDQLMQLPSPSHALVGADDLPPPPTNVRSSIFGDFQDELPPPPQEMCSLGIDADFTPPHMPPPPPVAITPVSRFLAAESAADKHKRISGISDLDDILSSMGSDVITPPNNPPSAQRPIESSEVLEDIDAMLTNLNLEIDSIIGDS